MMLVAVAICGWAANNGDNTLKVKLDLVTLATRSLSIVINKNRPSSARTENLNSNCRWIRFARLCWCNQDCCGATWRTRISTP